MNKTNRSFPTVAYGLFLCHLLAYSLRFIFALYRIDYSLLPCGFVYRFCAMTLPILLWLLSTVSEAFNYHRFKLAAYIATLYYETLIIITVVFQLLSKLFLPSVLAIETDEIFTKGMVLFLARLITELPLLPLFYILMKSFLRPARDAKSRSVILSFKLTYYLQTGKQKRRIQYPLSIARDIRSGKRITISETDRFLHTLVDGTSGTGKTSSTILPAIRDDLDIRCQAEQEQIKAMHKLVQDGLYTYTGSFSYFSLSNFRPAKEAMPDSCTETAATYASPESIRMQYPVCGITVLAPEDSLTDDVCRLCEARGIPYHRIDATHTFEGTLKPNWTGMNPFFISPSLSGNALHQAIVKKAVIFSDVMQVITDLKGKADSYFTGLNRQMLANLAILVMNTVPVLYKRQATPADLQLLINNFDLLPPYVSKLDELDREQKRYSFISQYIREDLLGKGCPKMEDQSRGTRNIINEFLLMPESKDVYCAQASIDFDQILENGEITVCNYDLASGDSNAIAFGLFFLLSFNNAVLSRPGTEKTRIPHFFYVDELPVLIHSSLEKNFSLFRKFRVAMFCAIQTLDQFEKNEITKYLKGVILGCAHIFVFGRSSLSDMEVFSAMAGIHDEVEEQSTVSETALSDDSPSLSYSSRETCTQKNLVEETDIRMKDFQEITLFTTKNGRPLPPLHARVEFLKSGDWSPEKREAFSAKIFRPYTGPASSASPASSLAGNSCAAFSGRELVSEYCCYDFDSSETRRSAAPKMPSPSQTQESRPPVPDGSESLDGLF